MIINNSAFTLFFPENKNIRDNFFKMEEHFQDFQHPFTLVTLPMEAPAEIPRILAATKNGHSQLTISCLQKGDAGEPVFDGIASRHAYIVTGTTTEMQGEKTIYYVRVRNPWNGCRLLTEL